jgi:hypothetical protein
MHMFPVHCRAVLAGEILRVISFTLLQQVSMVSCNV